MNGEDLLSLPLAKLQQLTFFMTVATAIVIYFLSDYLRLAIRSLRLTFNRDALRELHKETGTLKIFFSLFILVFLFNHTVRLALGIVGVLLWTFGFIEPPGG